MVTNTRLAAKVGNETRQNTPDGDTTKGTT
jgi:hypothetical protein